MLAKFIVGIAIVAFTSACGYVFAKKYRQRKLFFRQLREFNERFLSEITYYRRPLREFSSKYVYKGEFAHLLQAYFSTLDFRLSALRERLTKSEFSFLKKENKGLVEDYFTMLGKGDSTSQKGYFSSINSTLIKLQEEAAVTCKKYADLYVKLGFLCGLLILILII